MTVFCLSVQESKIRKDQKMKNYNKNNDSTVISCKVLKVEPAKMEIKTSDYRKVILEISKTINEGGYNPVSQLLGYILSEDPTHISSYKNARNIINGIDRDALLEDMVRFYLEGGLNDK